MGILGILIISYQSCNILNKKNENIVVRPPAKKWMLGGLLPVADETFTKVYLTIEGQRIIQIHDKKPTSTEGILVLETEDLIFPGLIDLYNQTEYSTFPLWMKKNLYDYRPEWFEGEPHRSFLSQYSHPFVGKSKCPSIRYGEIKALVGGASTLLGGTTEHVCSSNFGVRNVEIPDDIDLQGEVLVESGIRYHSLLKNIFIHQILPVMKKRDISYDDAYQLLLADSGIQYWIESFLYKQPDLHTALELTLGEFFENTKGIKSRTPLWGTLKPKITQILKQKKRTSHLSKDLEELESWIDAFLVLTERDRNIAHQFLAKEGVFQFDRDLRQYVGFFEGAWRQKIIAHLKRHESFAPTLLFLPMAEGNVNNPYPQIELFLLEVFGINKPGLVVIHGTGLKKEDLFLLSKNGTSIVWTPFSDQYLYNQTLNIKEASKLGINIALGSGWSHLGTKNILDQLKFAREYLDHQKTPKNVISDRDLVDMVTVNAARAIRKEHFLGRIAKDYAADILLIKKKPGDPYTTLVNSDQSHIKLIVVKGEPVFGDTSILEKFVWHWEEPLELLENITPDSKNCLSLGSKSLRSLKALPSQTGPNTLAEIKSDLNSLISRDRSVASLSSSINPLFSCADPNYLSFKKSLLKKSDRKKNDPTTHNPFGSAIKELEKYKIQYRETEE